MTPRDYTGRWTDAEPVRAHLRPMLALGSEIPALERAAGVKENTVVRLFHVRSERMLRANAEKLLALPVRTYRRMSCEWIELPRGVEHGTRRGYRLKCRCDECVTAERRYQRDWERDGERRYVPVEPVAAHIERLIAAGCRITWIAKAAKVDFGTVNDARKGRNRTMQRAKAEAILAVRKVTFDDWQYVDAAMTLERVRKLNGLGYSRAWIAKHLGHEVPKPTQRYVRLWMAREVAALFEFAAGADEVMSADRVVLDVDRLRSLRAEFEASDADLFGQALARLYYRALEGETVTIAGADRLASALETHVDRLLRTEVAA